MREIIRQDQTFVYREVTAEEARQVFKDQPYKLALIDDLVQRGTDEYGQPSSEPVAISFYTHGIFTDLCRGPHVHSTAEINPDAIKLMSVAGAYWRGSEKNPMLQRLYGTAFETPKELEDYQAFLAEVEKRDHRRLGKQLDLFSMNAEQIGSGLALWHPKGALMRHLAEQFCKDAHLENGYDFVYTPHIGRAQLWQTSGHLDFFKDNMYAPLNIDGQEYYLKPMNCPFHIHVYKSRTRQLPRFTHASGGVGHGVSL